MLPALLFENGNPRPQNVAGVAAGKRPAVALVDRFDIEASPP